MYACEICSRRVAIRTRIKEGEYANYKACPLCVKKHRPRDKSKGEFFEREIQKVSGGCACQNCGLVIRRPTAFNIAHILPKRKYKSVSTSPFGILHLCTTTDRTDGEQGCHQKFDSHSAARQSMLAFKIAKAKLLLIKEQIEERGSEYFEFFND